MPALAPWRMLTDISLPRPSIRTYNDRFERSMYILNMYWTIWFLYTLFINFDGEPFKKYIAISNTFVLVCALFSSSSIVLLFIPVFL